ncbi:hypothetical protein TNCV_4797781 [Trichonephila clavipes]|nr:hypothetical protein TNCV_4797781 [Trichonephila clavipes]
MDHTYTIFRLTISRGQSDLCPSWPPRSPDLPGCDYFLRETLMSKVYRNNPFCLQQLEQSIFDEIAVVPESSFDIVSTSPTLTTDRFSRPLMGRTIFSNDQASVLRGGLMVWAGLSIGACTDEHIIRNGNLTAQRIMPGVCDGSIRDPSSNPLGKSLGYQFALFTINPTEEENRDMQIKLLYIVDVF